MLITIATICGFLAAILWGSLIAIRGHQKTARFCRELTHKERLHAMKHGRDYNVMAESHIRALGAIGVAVPLCTGISFFFFTATAMGLTGHNPLLKATVLIAILGAFVGLNGTVCMIVLNRLYRINPVPEDPTNHAGEVIDDTLTKEDYEILDDRETREPEGISQVPDSTEPLRLA